ncbi:MAG: hypothetical protein RR747_06415 [Gordonibacter sp.]
MRVIRYLKNAKIAVVLIVLLLVVQAFTDLSLPNYTSKIVDVGKSSLTIEATGDESKLKGMEDLFRAYGIKEITRTGKIAMSRNSKD